MSVTDVRDDELDVALSMIDTRRWGARLRIVAIIRVLQRRSTDGIARIGHQELARRAGITGRYCWDLTGTGRSSQGLMWRIEHVLELVDVGTGRRPTGWRVRPVKNWRGVPWLEELQEIRRLRLDDVSRAPHRDANDGLASELHGATQSDLASRWLGAMQDSVASRSTSRRYEGAFVAPRHRDATASNCVPTARDFHGSGGDEPPAPEQQQEGDFVEAAVAALWHKTGRETKGRLLGALRRLEAAGVELEWLIRAINAAPDNLLPPKILDEWVPMVRKHGIPATNGTATTVAELLTRPDCPTCGGSHWVETDDGVAPCPECAPRERHTPVAQ